MSMLAIPETSNTVVVTETALEFAPDMTLAEWKKVGQTLGRASRASAWWIGDWINYGEDAGYVSRGKFESAEKLTGLARGTLWNYAAVARCFESSRRREDLVFGHHASVAALAPAEQDKALVRAEKEAWSIDRLRQETHTRPVSAGRVFPGRRHATVVDAASVLVRAASRWERSMTDELAPPEARKQLTALKKAADHLAEIIEAVEYRAATPHRFLGN